MTKVHIGEPNASATSGAGMSTVYLCPTCKGGLAWGDGALTCRSCRSRYSVKEGIPDFILEDLTQSTNPVLRGVRGIDRLSRIYETKLWYPLILNLYGGLGAPSLERLTRITTDLVQVEEGTILDVACGPGTLGRRMASDRKAVYGIDISMGMIRKGVDYVKRDAIPNVHFARARVEALPFADDFFDGAVCGGALHLFTDTTAVLREIARTMKQNAPLAVMTFTAGQSGILRSRRVREHIERDHGIRVFQLSELEGYLAEAGFEGFQHSVYGSILVFGAWKKGPRASVPGDRSERESHSM